MAVELDVANLVLAVDSTGVVKANTALDELAVKGELVGKSWESGAQRAGSAGRQLGQAVEQTTTDIQRRIDALVNGKSKSWVTDILSVDPQRASTITGTYAILFRQIEDQEKAHAAKMLELQKAEQEALAVQAAQAAARSREQRLTIAPGAPAYIGPPSSSAGPTYGAMTKAEAEAAAAKQATFAAQNELNTAMRDYSALMQGVIISEEHMTQVQNSLNLLLKEGKIAQVEYNAAQAAFNKAQFLIVPPGGAKAVSDLKGELKEAEGAAVGFAGGMNKAKIAAELSTVSTELAGGNIAQLRRSIAALVNQTGVLRAVMTPAGLGITAIIAAIVGISIAEAKGQQAQNEYNASLALTDHYAGLALGSIHAMADEVKGAGVTVGNAISVFTKLAESGKYTADQVELIGKAALLVSQRTGQSADDIVKQFEHIEQEPAKAVLEYDKMYHFLTAATLQRINELEREGKTQEAAYVAQQALSDTMVSRLQNEQENVGYLTQAWRGLKDMISEAATAVESWGQKQEHLDKASDARAQASTMLDVYLERRSSTGLAHVWAEGKFGQFTDEQLLAQINHFNDIAVAEEKLAHAQDEANRKQADADQRHTEALANANSYAQQGLTLQQALTAERIKYKNTLDNLRPDEKTSAYLAELQKGEDRTLLSIQRSYDRKDRVPSDHGLGRAQQSLDEQPFKDALKSATTDLQTELDKQRGLLQSHEEDANTFYSNEVIAIVNWRNQTLDALHKQEDAIRANMGTGKTYIESEKKLQALQDQEGLTEQQYADKIQKASNERIAARNAETRAITSYQVALDREIARQQKAGNRAINNVSLGGDYKSFIEKKQEIDDAYTNRLQELDDSRETMTDEDYQKGCAAAKAAHDYEIALSNDQYNRLKQAQSSWQNGAKAGFMDVMSEYGDVAANTEQLVTQSFDSFNSMLSNALETGKLNFKSFALSVIDDITMMMVKAAEAKIVSMILDGAGGGGGGDVGSNDFGGSSGAGMTDLGSTSDFSTMAAKGAAFDGGGLVAMRRGGYMVSSPTLRTMANGGTAMIGEAHPEGVFPLTRDNAGNLGIAAVGSKSNGGTQVIIKDYSGGQKPEVHESTNADGQKLIEIVLGKAEDRISQSVANGKVGKAIQGRFGISKQGQRY